jgi:predicted ribosome quality control (RQC) complex YloA/Tae2 family protein
MNNFYSLIYQSEFLKDNFKDRKFDYSSSPYRDVWEGYFSNNEDTIRLVFSVRSGEIALFQDQYRAPKKANTMNFFESVSGSNVSDLSLAETDRFITVKLDNDSKLLFTLFGNSPNVFLIKKGLIADTFKDPSKNIGKPEPLPRSSAPQRKEPSNNEPRSWILYSDPRFPRHLIQPVIDHYKLASKSSKEIVNVTEKLSGSMLHEPQFRVLDNGNLCLIPDALLPLRNEKVFSDINDAIRHTFYHTSGRRRLAARLGSVKPSLEKLLKKTKGTLSQLQNADKGLIRADEYEQWGHLLMSQAHIPIEHGAEKVIVNNFYNENEEVNILVDSQLSVAENAQKYYEKAGKSRKSVEEAKKRLKEIEEKVSTVIGLLEGISEIDRVYELEAWEKENSATLTELGIIGGSKQKEPLPFRRFEIESFEIWLGKNAKSNDKMIARAHKEDVWMHARGVGGSHLIIRMNNNSDYPPKHIVLKAASVAAWNSKARGSSLVPVIITKLKYITKPKGAPAGAVRVQKERVEMVEPKNYSEL